MLNTESIKKGYHKAGKSFVLLFNRVSMYGPGHPFSVQAVDEFFHSMQDLLQATSPVPEWDGQPVRMAQEEDAIVGADGAVRWALKRQDALFLVR